ncbi:hypothetical protein DVH24_015532 [Malus domestica]|uniref:Uncharacterized protein n=1 Tax=Malus domestica TaxID=3750 RepID=A0A498HJM3_MALDO|nr:hypothetical protein DVH24_015532 [Malus domestica]
MEHFPSSAFKIYTHNNSARARALGFAATATPSYSLGPDTCLDGQRAVGHRNPAFGSSGIASFTYQHLLKLSILWCNSTKQPHHPT